MLMSHKVFSGEPDEKLHKNCLYPTVAIRSGQSAGTGIIVRSEKHGEIYRNVIITCLHVIYSGEVKILIPKYKNWSEIEHVEIRAAKVYSIDIKKDLAVLMCNSNEKLAEAELGFDEQLHMGDVLHGFGCATGEAPHYKEGKISNLSADFAGTKLLKTTIFSAEGDSGFGVCHNYKVIGIMRAIAGSKDAQGNIVKLHGISLITPIREIKNWSEQEVDFIYNREEKVPCMPFYEIKMETCLKKSKELLPKSRWEK